WGIWNVAWRTSRGVWIEAFRDLDVERQKPLSTRRQTGGGFLLDIAIVGLGCRFPEAPDPLSYWDLVRNGTVTFREIPASRWNHAKIFLDASLRAPDKAYIGRGAYLDDAEVREFGALHFGLAPRRVQVTDPQHRLMLDVVRCALQDAGWERKLFPRRRAGVFIGASVSEYKEIHLSRLRVLQMLDGQYGRRPDPDAARALEA